MCSIRRIVRIRNSRSWFLRAAGMISSQTSAQRRATKIRKKSYRAIRFASIFPSWFAVRAEHHLVPFIRFKRTLLAKLGRSVAIGLAQEMPEAAAPSVLGKIGQWFGQVRQSLA